MPKFSCVGRVVLTSDCIEIEAESKDEAEDIFVTHLKELGEVWEKDMRVEEIDGE